MGDKANVTPDGESATSQVDDAESLETTAVMETVDEEPMQDDDATVVLGDTYRVNVTSGGDL